MRQPGRRFLDATARPVKDWRNRRFWTRAIQDLRAAYHSICAYRAHWIPWGDTPATVDHFIPKSIAPDLAYEWSNFRLACPAVNNRKRDYQDVLDPFEIECGWFVLDFPSLQVLPGADVGPTLAVQVQATICRLGLNDESTVKDRLSWLKQFLAHHDLPLLREFAPFIAHELERQGVTEAIDEIMGENLGSLD